MSKEEESTIVSYLKKILVRLDEMKCCEDILERLDRIDQTLDDHINHTESRSHAYDTNLSDYMD